MAKKVLRFLDRIEMGICVLSILVMLVILTFQVLSRYVLRQSNIWTEELARYLYIWLVFIGTSYAEKEFIHIKIDVLGRVFPKRVRPFAAMIGEIVLIVFSLYMCYISVPYVQGVLNRGQYSQALKISMVFPYAAIPVGFALLAFRAFINIVIKKYIPAEEFADLGDVDSSMLHEMSSPESSSDGEVFP